MLTTYRRHSIVLTLLAVAGIASIVARPPQAQAVALPSLAALTAGTGWHVVGTYSPPGGRTMMYQEWSLRDAQGTTALLYLAATSAVQKMVHWTGELGYQGAGYQVVRRQLSHIYLRDGTVVPTSVVLVQHLADREALDYAVVSPHGITARSTDDLLHVGWDTLWGREGPYYLVRVSLPQHGSGVDTRAASSLLSAVLSRLPAEARASRQ